MDTVRDRVTFTHGPPAADAVYCQLCNVNFRTGKQIPQMFLAKDVQCKIQKYNGRHKDLVRTEAFLKTVKYLEENDDEQISVGDLILKMSDYTEPEN